MQQQPPMVGLDPLCNQEDQILCPSGHAMVFTNKVPYKTLFGGSKKTTTCTACKCQIIGAFFFYNCIKCRVDYCHDCGEERKGRTKPQQKPY